MDIVAVCVAQEAEHNVILDTGREDQCELDRRKNVFRALQLPADISMTN